MDPEVTEIAVETETVPSECPKYFPPPQHLRFQDQNGKIFHVRSLNVIDDSGQLLGLCVTNNFNAKGPKPSAPTRPAHRKRKRTTSSKPETRSVIKSEKDADADADADAEELGSSKNTQVDGYDPSTGEVLGPEGQPIGPGNGSVVVREIRSEKEINQAWFTTKEDKSALSEKGINWKQGTWSSQEVALLNANIFDYCHRRGIEDPVEIIFDMSKDDRKDFYRCVSRGLRRPLFSVYRRVIRMYDAKNHIGRYTGDELEKLRILRDQFGTDWAKIGAEMGRSAASVKDRCRLLKDYCKSGKWETDEEDRLVEAVYAATGKPRGSSVTCNVPWSQVADVVSTRSEKQCRTKWLNYLNWKQADGKREWTANDDYQLISKVSRLGSVEESTIDWIALSDGWPAVRSPQWLRGKWTTLKRTLPHHQTLSVNEACQLLSEDPTRRRYSADKRPSFHPDGSSSSSSFVDVGLATRPVSSALIGNDFWGVGEDSNGAITANDLNGIVQTSTLDGLSPTNHAALIRQPQTTFSIHSDLPSHFLIDNGVGSSSSSALNLSSGVVPSGVSVINGGGAGGDVLHLTSTVGHVPPETTFPASLLGAGVSSQSGIAAIDHALLPPTNAFPAFANVCINPVQDEAHETSFSGVASLSASPTRDSRDFALAVHRSSPIADAAVATTRTSTTTTITDDDDDVGETFMLTSSGHLIPFRSAGDNSQNDALLTDVAIFQDDGAQYEIECIENDEEVDNYVRIHPDSTLVSDEGYILIDASADGTVTAVSEPVPDVSSLVKLEPGS